MERSDPGNHHMRAGIRGRDQSHPRSRFSVVLFPIERVTEVVEHWPRRCGCGRVFDDGEREPSGAPARHQVAELPPLAVEISEHRLQRVCCPDCGRTVRAELPAGVPRGCFGPKLEAAIAALTVRNRLSRRQLAELLEELYGCPIAIGTVDAILSRAGETLAPVYDELLEQTRAASALNVDETGWYLSGEPRTLWGAFSKQTAVLRIAPDRGKTHLQGLVGDGFAGVVGSDRFSAYNRTSSTRGSNSSETATVPPSSSASTRSKTKCDHCSNGARAGSGNGRCTRSRRTS